jgi:ligand-binding sensor domain-containing protein/signal transduction histidine kinase
MRFGAAFGITMLSLAFCSNTLGQEYYVQNWHVEDGLPDGEITSIQETAGGSLWVGTPKGLARFDGVRFKVFKAGSTAALTDSRITWLLASRDGTLWISTQDGNVTQYEHGNFESVHFPAGYASDKKETRAPGGSLWERRMHLIESGEGAHDDSVLDSCSHLVEDGQGAIWWHVSDTIVMRYSGNHWTVITPTNGLPTGGVRQLAVDHEGHVWVEAGGKLHRYDSNGWDFDQKEVSLGGPWPVLAPANRGGLWVAEPRGSWFLKGGQVRRFANGQWSGDPQPIPLIPLTSRSTVTCLMEDHAGRIWYGTAAGGVFFSDPDGNWQRLRSKNPFSQGYISCLFEDNHGNVWVGTVGDGLYRITPQPLTMLKLPPPMDTAEVNTTYVARDGAIWMGTGGSGIARLDKEGHYTMFGIAQGLDNLHACALLEDSHTNIWVGTSGGLFRGGGERFAQVNGPPEISKWIKVLFEDRAGRLWIGAIGGLVCHEAEQFKVYHLRPDRAYCDIRSIAEDALGDLWIGTIGEGLFRLPHGRPDRLHRVEAFPATDARALFCDTEGTLWIGSWGEGLLKRVDGKFTQLTVEDGLPSDRIQSIIDDAEGRLWLSTDNGIVGIAPKKVIEGYERGRSPPLWCEHLSLAEGLANRVCSGSGQPVSARTSDGRIWFPDYEGVAVLNPHGIPTKSDAPSVWVETVLAEGKPLTIPRSGELQAPSSVSRFEFDYTAPDIASPQNVRFRYKLDGMDHEWVEAGPERVAYYSQLKPGDYDFRVMVGGSDGEWHGTDQVVHLRVVPRLWERRWIQVMGGALFIAVLGGGIAWAQRRKLRLQMERLEMQQALEKERRRIARDLHDELGARLTATALHGELVVQDGTMPDNAKSEMSLIARRVRQLIGAVDEVVWTTDPENDSLSNLVAFLCDYVEQFLAPTGISYRLEIAPDLPAVPLGAQVRRNLLLAVKEALNNSVRHADAQKILLKIRLDDAWLIVEVSDDGHGFKIGGERAEGKGLSNIKGRMELVMGRAEIKSETGAGTTVTLSVPLPKVGAFH